METYAMLEQMCEIKTVSIKNVFTVGKTFFVTVEDEQCSG